MQRPSGSVGWSIPHVHEKVAGSIPGRGSMGGFQSMFLYHIDVSLSLSVFLFLAPLHSLSPPFSLSSILSLFNKYILRRGLINKKVKYKSREVTLPVFCISRNILYYICMYIIYFCLNIYISAIYIYSNRYPTKRLTTL